MRRVLGFGLKMSQSLDEQSTRLYRIRKTVMEMLRDRDYVVAEFELTLNKDQFREKYGDEPKREDLVIQKPRRSNNAEHVSGFLACTSLGFWTVWDGFCDFGGVVSTSHVMLLLAVTSFLCAAADVSWML